MARSWYRFTYLDDSALASGIVADSNASHTRLRRSPPPANTVHGLVSAGKGTAAYNAHSYPTKVPPEGIAPFIEYFTKPGDIVLDPFCGSGMTGLAALRSNRVPVLNDLSSLAMHLAYNHTTPCDADFLANAWASVRAELKTEERRHYRVKCNRCSRWGMLRYTIWSDVYRCPKCNGDVNLWDGATERERNRGTKLVRCTGCGHKFPKSAASRIRSEPTWVSYKCGCTSSLLARSLSRRERRAACRFPPPPRTMFVPSAAVEPSREMYQRSALHLRGIQGVRDFYTPRNLSALSHLWSAIRAVRDKRVRFALAFAFTNTAWHGTKMRRFNSRGGQRPLTGTLYVPQLSSEANVFDVFDNKIRQLVRFYGGPARRIGNVPLRLNRGSATRLAWIPDASIDYVFTDPPFGSNIFYADCNLIAEAWLGEFTDEEQEAVVNRSRRPEQGGKTLNEYGSLIASAFREMYRVLRPDCWATVVFQSSDGAVWSAIEAAAQRAGFEVHSAQILDKVQQSMKGYKGRNGTEHVASFDVVIHMRKRARSKKARALRVLQLEEQAQLILDALGAHLRKLDASDRPSRTLPFLYSVSVRTLLNAGGSVHRLSMRGLRRLLNNAGSIERDGLWYSPTADSSDRDYPLHHESEVGLDPDREWELVATP